jgi:Ras-related protein Ral-A
MRDHYMAEGEGFLCLYSITSEESFQALKHMLEALVRVKDMESRRIPMVIVGNKIDLEADRKVKRAEADLLADQYSCQHYETSAKTNINVETVYFQLVREIWRVEALPPIEPVESDTGRRRSDTHTGGGGGKKCIIQ